MRQGRRVALGRASDGLDEPEGADRTRGKQVYGDVTAVRHLLEGWTTVAQYKSGSSDATHTVESDSTGKFPEGYRCTCQGFKIPRRGVKPDRCKHTIRAHQEGLK